jgi:hypothetical protein
VKYPQTQLGDASNPAYYTGDPRLSSEIPPTQLGDSFKSCLQRTTSAPHCVGVYSLENTPTLTRGIGPPAFPIGANHPHYGGPRNRWTPKLTSLCGGSRPLALVGFGWRFEIERESASQPILKPEVSPMQRLLARRRFLKSAALSPVALAVGPLSPEVTLVV